MRLDWVEKTGQFVLRIPRDSARIKELINEHGLNYSRKKSTLEEACLYTDSVYAAMTYADAATSEARAKMGRLLDELEASRRLVSDRRCVTPEGKELYPYQRADMDYIMRRSASLVGDEPGLGKTPVAICAANEARAKRVLVVCPAAVRGQWAERIREWSTIEGRYIIHPIFSSADGVHPQAAWTVVSYDLLRSPSIFSALERRGFDMVILDEAHYLKTSRSQRTKACFGEKGLAFSADMVLALTGTPLPNRPKECYTLARALCWDSIDYMSEEAFQARFNPSRVCTNRDGKRYVKEKVGRLLELQNRLRSNFMVRHRKRDVLSQLPDIRYEIVHVEETGEIKKALEAEKLLDIDPEDLRGADAQTLGHISTVRMMMGLAKAPLAADYIEYLLSSGEEKLVVFGWHVGVLDALQERLGKHGVVRIDGSTASWRRQSLVNKFIEDPNTKIFLGNLQSVGVGVDGLQRVCNRAVFAECSWTPADNDQGVGRLERIGQKCGILVEFLVAPGSFDERVLRTSLRKLRDIHASLDQ